ncbi:MAG TPA: glycosyltransferase [Acidimicrobiales bacterium]|nr:glycosyltransferase [Acidimicrobiales bacterium]
MNTIQHSITVVLPTHRRVASLTRVIEALGRQHDPGAPWNLVVIDNDDPPGTAHSVNALQELEVPWRVVIETAPGASNARNRGVAEATGTVVAFIDDDVLPRDDWLATLVAPLLEARCDGVGGRVELDPSVPRPPWLPAWLLPYLAEFAPSDTEVDLRTLAPEILIEPYLLTANAAFTSDILHRCGGFDPLLGPRRRVPLVNDDLALCRRVFGAGGTIRFVPRAHVVHELPAHRLQRRYMLRRLYAQGRSDWMLNREEVGATRTAGVRSATLDFGLEIGRLAMAQRLPGPRRTFLWCEAARRAGFLREAIAHLARGRRPLTPSNS